MKRHPICNKTSTVAVRLNARFFLVKWPSKTPYCIYCKVQFGRSSAWLGRSHKFSSIHASVSSGGYEMRPKAHIIQITKISIALSLNFGDGDRPTDRLSTRIIDSLQEALSCGIYSIWDNFRLSVS